MKLGSKSGPWARKMLKVACLCAPGYRGVINTEIRPECSEQYNQIARMGCGTTWGAGSGIDKNGGIAAKSGRFDEEG